MRRDDLAVKRLIVLSHLTNAYVFRVGGHSFPFIFYPGSLRLCTHEEAIVHIFKEVPSETELYTVARTVVMNRRVAIIEHIKQKGKKRDL